MTDGIMEAHRVAGNAGIDPAAELTAPVVKRGRGRPRKVRKFDEDPKNESKMPMEIKHEVKYGEENKEPAVIIESGKFVDFLLSLDHYAEFYILAACLYIWISSTI